MSFSNSCFCFETWQCTSGSNELLVPVNKVLLCQINLSISLPLSRSLLLRLNTKSDKYVYIFCNYLSEQIDTSCQTKHHTLVEVHTYMLSGSTSRGQDWPVRLESVRKLSKRCQKVITNQSSRTKVSLYLLVGLNAIKTLSTRCTK